MESDISVNSKILFGQRSVYIDTKRRLGSKKSHTRLPDAFLFDLSGEDSFRLHLVQVEISSRDFYGHIFPRTTRLLDFFKNMKGKAGLGEKLLSIIDSSVGKKDAIRKHMGLDISSRFAREVIENGQDILLIMDGEKEELSDVMEKNPDTWGKTIKLHILKKYHNGHESIYSLNPAFEGMEGVENESTADADQAREDHHREETHRAAIEQPVRRGSPSNQLTRKVIITKISGRGNYLGETWTGWETAPPKESEPYRIRVGGGKVLKTSPVQLVTETKDTCCVMTANSLYEYKIVESGEGRKDLQSF
jgi:hypothetical protein